MAFSTIITVVIIGYVFLYVGMIVYDIFFKKDPADLIPKQEDEDIDISDEVGQFQPILIEKDPKPDNKTKEQPPTGEKVEEETGNNDGGAKTKPPVSSETKDDEPTNRKSLDDIEPKAANKEEREKIQDLVKQVRKDMENEEEGNVAETGNSKEKSEETTTSNVEVKTEKASETPNKDDNPKDTISGTSSGSSTSGTTSSPRKPSVTPKSESTKKVVRPWEKEKKRTGPIPVYEWKARIDPDNQKTKVCGGETAESFSNKLNSYSIQELRALGAKNNNHWDEIEKARKPTEGDLEIIRMAESGNRKKPPSFRRTST